MDNISNQMDIKSNDKDKKKDKQSADLDILRKDEQFWQRAVKILARNEIQELKNAENDNKAVVKHTERSFNIHCKCDRCIIFRQTIIGTYVENCAYNQLWSKLQEIIRSYYKFLPDEQDSIIKRKYQELLTESCGIHWFSDGSIDVKKNIHVSMGSYFSISNEMTFMIVFNMLYARDKHQLFELLCLQLSLIILAYREGIKEITKCVEGDEEYYKPEEFLNYILDGYDRITEISETQTPLVIEMREHLQTFSLTWQLMNQCMYYRFLYVDIESRMADCILRLKEQVDAETYKSFVYRFIKFDEEMTAIGQVWEVALVALELYRKSTPDQIGRVERIAMIHQIYQSMRNLNDIDADIGKPLSDQVLALDWIVSSENDEVWLSVINSIRSEPFMRKNKNCKCWACLISDGNHVPDICAIPDDSKMDIKKKTNDECYHLAWCVFNHLKDRKAYTKTCFHPEIFCVFNDPPCERMECQVATNLIIGSYPLSFTKFLLRIYQPLSPSDREKFLKVPSQSLIRKFCRKKGGAAAKEIMHEADEINHTFLLLNMFWDDDEIADPTLRAGLAAALAENFKIDVKFPQKHIIFSYFHALFRMDPSDGGDIVLDLEWLEQINLANLFKSFSHETHSLNSTSSIEPIEMQLNELKITAEVSAGSNALDLVQFSMKEVADKLSSISLSDDTENAKAVIENEIKKPLVEALKLAASNKKLEAELKSLQKEHNMLKDMVKGLEQIHGEKKEVQVTVTATKPPPDSSQPPTKCNHGHSHGHSHNHSGSSSPVEEHGKDDCVCYYCTLFGKNQDLVTNPRSTEARDRLRKKLHHLQNQKDFTSKSKNLKNISLLLKNGTPSSPRSSPSSQAQHSSTKHTENSPQPKSSTASASIGGGSMKMKVELELQHRKKKTTLIKPNYNNKPEDIKIQDATEINIKSLENLIEYIEGPSSKAVAEQKKAEEAAAKKLLKKAKQQQLKVRRQIDQQLEVLKNVNNDLLEVNIDIKQVQNQISQLKSSRGKSKENKESKRVKAAEEKLNDLITKRKKVETNVKNIIDGVKVLNPEINVIDECLEMKAVMNLIAPDLPLPKQPPQTSNNNHQQASSSSSSNHVQYAQQQQQNIPKPVPVRATLQNTANVPPPPSQQAQQTSANVQQQQNIPQLVISPKGNEEDPAKRMVTIRRVNLPHAEPQVTVTAKGTTPDKDQLLYTFVNGQLVPASSLHPTAFQNQNGSLQIYMSSSDVEEHNKAASEQVLENNKHNGKNNNNNKKEPQLTKKQQQQAIEKVIEKSRENKKNEKIEKKKEQPVQPPQTALTMSNSQTSIKKSSKDNKNAKKKSDPVKKEDEKHVDEQQVKKKTRKVYIDPEFAANPFKLLLDDDDDEEEFTTETDEENSNHDNEETNSIIEKMSNMEIASKNNKKSKDEPKNVKKQAQNQQQLSLSQQNVKNDKNLQKKQQVQHVVNQKGKIIERQDSVTSATSSNNSKDSKQLNKNNKKLKNVNEPPKSYVQSFPLHPQYQPTVYKPTDYVKKPTISAQPSHQNSNSIMDQLNRGIRVEGLRLPPGITLTKVAPTNEAISTKRDSINRITQPMQDYGQQSSRTGLDDHNMVYSQGRDPNGIIMVESNPHAAAQKQQQQMQHHQQQPNEMNSNPKKKNKKKKSKGDGNDGSSNKLKQQQSNGGERMVTLKNPMFFNNNNSTASNSNNNNNNNNISSTNNGNSETMMSMMRNLQTPPFISPMNDPQQASIIKNENGMYTIRNPAFQNAFGAAGSSSSNNSGPIDNNSTSSNRSSFMPFDGEQSQPKCSSVIGSEMKNALQRRKEQEYAHLDPYQYGMRSSSSQYSHFGGSGVNFNQNNAAGCDENYMHRPNNYQSYPSQSINYDDLRLQPGKMLNSEVTIHNVTESKFFQNQTKAQAPIGTPRNLISDITTPKLFGDLLIQPTLISRPHAPPAENESAKYVSQGRNSVEIENDERDIEMFKQFDMNYVAPKQKMKCNINMNEIHVNPKKSTVAHVMGEDFDRKHTSSTNSNSPSSLASSSMDELYEKAPCSYYATHHNLTDEKSSAASSLFSSSNGM
ncbi:hypothetical protein ACKWTF_010242 [Chironomus riparius]